MKQNILHIIYASLILVCIINSKAFADETPQPTEAIVGTSCSDLQTSFLWSVSTRTQWKLIDLYAVPVGLFTPEDWNDSTEFRGRFREVLPADPSIENFAESCSSVWSEFFSSTADVLVLLQRTISTRERIVECNSGFWTVTSDNTSTSDDNSDWIRVGDAPFDTTADSSTESLKQLLQNLIDGLNGQPGASTVPVDSFVKQQ